MIKPDAVTELSTNRRQFRPPALKIVALMIVWILLWGDLSWGNVVSGLALGLLVTFVAPMPTVRAHGYKIRPIALLRLIFVFIWDVIVASTQIAWDIVRGHKPNGAIIRVQTRAHSDVFLAATSGFTALVPGSIVIDAHRLTGMMYVHVFDAPDAQALQESHDRVLAQEERILRALAPDQMLIEAGYVPGGSMKLGRLPNPPATAQVDAERPGNEIRVRERLPEQPGPADPAGEAR